MGAFLSSTDICDLTGRKTKSKQIEMLRKMGLPFFINAAGKPIVPATAIEGKKTSAEKNKWIMPE